MGRRTENDAYTEEETERRMIAALRRALSSPHKPHEPLGKRKAKPMRAPKRKARS